MQDSMSLAWNSNLSPSLWLIPTSAQVCDWVHVHPTPWPASWTGCHLSNWVRGQRAGVRGHFFNSHLLAVSVCQRWSYLKPVYANKNGLPFWKLLRRVLRCYIYISSWLWGIRTLNQFQGVPVTWIGYQKLQISKLNSTYIYWAKFSVPSQYWELRYKVWWGLISAL